MRGNGYLYSMNMQLKYIRKGQKIKIKDIKLDPRTIQKIERGQKDVSISSLEAYLEAIGMQLTISLK